MSKGDLAGAVLAVYRLVFRRPRADQVRRTVWCSPRLTVRCTSRSYRSVQFSFGAVLDGQLFCTNVKGFRGGLAFKAHTFLYHSNPRSRVIKKRRRRNLAGAFLAVVRLVLRGPRINEVRDRVGVRVDIVVVPLEPHLLVRLRAPFVL